MAPGRSIIELRGGKRRFREKSEFGHLGDIPFAISAITYKKILKHPRFPIKSMQQPLQQLLFLAPGNIDHFTVRHHNISSIAADISFHFVQIHQEAAMYTCK